MRTIGVSELTVKRCQSGPGVSQFGLTSEWNCVQWFGLRSPCCLMILGHGTAFQESANDHVKRPIVQVQQKLGKGSSERVKIGMEWLRGVASESSRWGFSPLAALVNYPLLLASTNYLT